MLLIVLFELSNAAIMPIVILKLAKANGSSDLDDVNCRIKNATHVSNLGTNRNRLIRN